MIQIVDNVERITVQSNSGERMGARYSGMQEGRFENKVLRIYSKDEKGNDNVLILHLQGNVGVILDWEIE